MVLLSLLHLLWFSVVGSIDQHNDASTLLFVKASLINPLGRLNSWKLPESAGERLSSLQLRWCDREACSFPHVSHRKFAWWNSGTAGLDFFQPTAAMGSLHPCLSHHLILLHFRANIWARILISSQLVVAGLILLNASGNNFSAYLPEDFGNATMLEILDLRGNFFDSPIPGIYRNLGRLRYISLSGNKLMGQIRQKLRELSSLETIVLAYNQFKGAIPTCKPDQSQVSWPGNMQSWRIHSRWTWKTEGAQYCLPVQKQLWG